MEISEFDHKFELLKSGALHAGGGYLAAKDLNLRLTFLKTLLRDYSIEALPAEVNILSSCICNIRCVFCVGANTKIDEPYEQILGYGHQILPTAYQYHIPTGGEIFVDPYSEKMSKEYAKYGAGLRITSNGTRMTKEKLEHFLPLAKIIRISTCGSTEYIYEAIQPGGNFRRLVNNIRLLTRACELLPEEMRPEVVLVGPVMSSTIKDAVHKIKLAHALKVGVVGGFSFIFKEGLPESMKYETIETYKPLYNAHFFKAKEVAEEYGITYWPMPPFSGVEADENQPLDKDKLFLKIPEDHYENQPPVESYLDMEKIETEAVEIAEHVKANAHLGNPQDDEVSVKLCKETFSRFTEALERNKKQLERIVTDDDEEIIVCLHMERIPSVIFNGKVQPCCFNRSSFGVIDGKSFSEVYNSAEANEFRKCLYDGGRPKGCENCRVPRKASRKKMLSLLMRDKIFENEPGYLEIYSKPSEG